MKNKKVFSISGFAPSPLTPILIPFNENAKCWIIKRKQLTISKAKELVTNNKITKDLSDLQWNVQINLDEVFNLKQI